MDRIYPFLNLWNLFNFSERFKEKNNKFKSRIYTKFGKCKSSNLSFFRLRDFQYEPHEAYIEAHPIHPTARIAKDTNKLSGIRAPETLNTEFFI